MSYYTVSVEYYAKRPLTAFFKTPAAVLVCLVILFYLIGKALDEVAYVRFASVYREFKDLNTFMDELKKVMSGN